MSSCAICLEPELNSPAACVPCGHTFCLACITQWTRNPPRFGLSLCPQCRSPVREVQKLFISDWPVSGTGSGSGGQTTFTQLSAWQQFQQLWSLLVHFVSIPFHSLAQHGPELLRRLTVWCNQQAEWLVVLRDRLIRCAVLCRQEWQDLGRQAQCFVGAALLLVMLLLVQDLQDEDGIHRGIVLPTLLLLVNIVYQLLFVAVYIVYRPFCCFLACGLEVGVAAVDMVGVVSSTLLWVVWDVLCVPWLMVCVAARFLCCILSMLASVVRVCMFCIVLALSFGLPAVLAAPGNQGLRGQLPELLQAAIEWLRQVLLRHSQQVNHQQPPQQEPTAAPPRRRPNILREFLRLLSEELRNLGREEVRGNAEDEREVGGAEGQEGGAAAEEEVADGGGGGSSQAGAALEAGETLEVW